jgi:Putative Flp pilus-assembly TadE/G-like/von Willebrand factor type A domain
MDGGPLGSRAREERGQAIILTVIAFVVLLGFVGIVVDLGFAYYGQRELQSSADAAALAGASQLPDRAAANATAKQYGGASGGKNFSANLSQMTETTSTRCASSFPGCQPDNAMVVNESANVRTFFLRLFGLDNISLHVKSTACGPCGGRPTDVMLVLDRTGSMCTNFDGSHDPACTKLTNARSGMETLIGSLDPSIDTVGLAVLPPVPSSAGNCSTPPSNAYNSKTARYVLVPLSTDYLVNGALNHGSKLVSTIDCLPGSGSTSYATAIEQAQAELDRHGRPDADHVIVFFSDGAANTGPSYYPQSSPYRSQPCHQGIASAGVAKSKGTTVYAVGYTLNGWGGATNRCQAQSSSGPDEQPPITAYEALSEIASNADTFYNQPDPGSLDAIFANIAAKVTAPRLIGNDTP